MLGKTFRSRVETDARLHATVCSVVHETLNFYQDLAEAQWELAYELAFRTAEAMVNALYEGDRELNVLSHERDTLREMVYEMATHVPLKPSVNFMDWADDK